eukprot:SAG22_NODE_918_length_6500_cov_4.729105_2_plen_316_part_00
MYKKAETDLWTAEDFDVSKDVQDIAALTTDERLFIVTMLASFTAEDGIANESLVERFAQEVQIAEARFFFGFQMAMHNIHAEVYAMLMDVYVPAAANRTATIAAASATPAAVKKAAWCAKWIASEEMTFAHRLVAFACYQGIFGMASFASLFWLKHTKPGTLAGLVGSNDNIARDERLYTDFTSMLYGMLKQKPDDELVAAIVNEAVEIEKQFVAEDCDVSLIGLNPASMAGYIESVGDKLLQSLGCEAGKYGSPNPFDWLETHASEKLAASAASGKSASTAAAEAATSPMAGGGGDMGGGMMGGGLSFDMDDDF